MNSDVVIEVKNISKSFFLRHEKVNSVFEYLVSAVKQKNKTERLEVLKDVSFDVKKGEMLGIIGLNGSGKTTLLKILARIYLPDKGEISIKGKVIPFLELGTGFNPELSAIDNIVLYGIILGFTKREISKRITKIGEFAEIEKFLDTKLKSFSTGMQARLAFSTAIEVEPDVLIVDEVLSVGDLPFQKKSYNAFLEFKKREKTIIFVSHNLEQVNSLCDRVILIHKGKLHLVGAPEQVIKEYKKLAL